MQGVSVLLVETSWANMIICGITVLGVGTDVAGV